MDLIIMLEFPTNNTTERIKMIYLIMKHTTIRIQSTIAFMIFVIVQQIILMRQTIKLQGYRMSK